MKKLFTVILVLSAVLAWTGLALAAEVKVTAIKIHDFGLYHEIHHPKNPKTAASKSGLGKVFRDVTFKLIKATDRIPAKVGVSFGFQFVVSGRPKGAVIHLTHRYITPPWRPPGKPVMHGDEYPAAVRIGKNNMSIFTFTRKYAWKMAPGKWTRQILYKGKVLAEHTFEVYQPR